eukprot:CAMPEP_0196652792 /NCGR_PEP_ID=MMETSP1086-20130531/2231_1 /TAXON_ID=77921 /ORGANISM="Cyanoptyche  gloeocystis , Strain SAG4.97" /LENGTH=36 /DNA_ID= /DNA_START= /DNA_END= /DNA_ORIENTATION=
MAASPSNLASSPMPGLVQELPEFKAGRIDFDIQSNG